MHRKNLHLNDDCKCRNYLSPRRISTKPSGLGVTNGVWTAPTHSAGYYLRHRLSDLQKPPATMVRGIEESPRRSTVETGTYPQKQKPLMIDPILVPLSRGYPPTSSSKSLGEAVFIVVSLPPSVGSHVLTSGTKPAIGLRVPTWIYKRRRQKQPLSSPNQTLMMANTPNQPAK